MKLTALAATFGNLEISSKELSEAHFVKRRIGGQIGITDEMYSAIADCVRVWEHDRNNLGNTNYGKRRGCPELRRVPKKTKEGEVQYRKF